jgi:hypothetical protein
VDEVERGVDRKPLELARKHKRRGFGSAVARETTTARQQCKQPSQSGSAIALPKALALTPSRLPRLYVSALMIKNINNDGFFIAQTSPTGNGNPLLHVLIVCCRGYRGSAVGLPKKQSRTHKSRNVA